MLQLQWRGLGGGRLACVDVVEFGHLPEHLVAAAARGARVAEGVVLRGRLRQAGQQRRLLEVQLSGRFVEEDARRRLHADRRLAADGSVGDAVQIAGEDRALAMDFLVVERELGLDDLLPEGVLLSAEVEVAHQLHRDRRAALQRGAVGDVLDGSTEDPGQVDPVVLVEALVLDRDGGVLEVFGDFAPPDGRAQLIGLDKAEARPVGGEDLRGAAGQQRV